MVNFQYYKDVWDHCREILKKYYIKDFKNQITSYKQGEVFYDEAPAYRKTFPKLGRFDNFFYYAYSKKEFHPKNFLTEQPKDAVHWKYYRKDGKPLLVNFCIPVISINYDDLAKDYIPIDIGYFIYDRNIGDITHFCITEEKEDGRHYLDITTGYRMVEETEPFFVTEYVVSKDRKRVDSYLSNGLVCFHRHATLYHNQDYRDSVREDSKFVRISDLKIPVLKETRKPYVQGDQTSHYKKLIKEGFKPV